MEQWRRVPGYEDRYEISDWGRLRTYIKRGSNTGHYYTTPKIRKPIYNKLGYCYYLLYHRGGLKKQFSAHRLVLLTFVGPRPEGLEIRHLDGNPSNNKLNNLCYGTKEENEADKKRHGTVPVGDKHWSAVKPECVKKGENHPLYGKANIHALGENNWQNKRPEDTLKGIKNSSAILDETKVYVIRHILSSTDITLVELGQYYSVDPSTVSLIKRKIKWKHIEYPNLNEEAHNTLIQGSADIIKDIISRRVIKIKKPKINNPGYVKKGKAVGEKVSTAKLTKEDINNIFKMFYEQNMSVRDITEIINKVNRWCIRNIITARTWKHITKPLTEQYANIGLERLRKQVLYSFA